MERCHVPDLPTLLLLLAFVSAYWTSWCFAQTVVVLVSHLAPNQVPQEKLNWPMMWLGMLTLQAATPFAILRNLVMHDIEWAGIRYRIANGKVVHIRHKYPSALRSYPV
jgi:hypothetical protein